MSNKKKKPNGKSEKNPNLRTFDILRVDWNDHWTGHAGWLDKGEIKHSPMMNVSVGVLVKEDKNGLTLAQNMGTNFLVADTVYIIKNCIVNRKVLGQVAYDKET